jgi:hypothetical protein
LKVERILADLIDLWQANAAVAKEFHCYCITAARLGCPLMR